MPPTALGDITKSVFMHEVEAHKLHIEFTVRAQVTPGVDIVIKKGMPVKLHTDGTVQPVATGDPTFHCIGISEHDGVSGGNVTIAMKGFCSVTALAKEASFTAGPVKYYDYDLTKERARYSNSSVTYANCNGWCLNSGTSADDEVIIVLAT